MNLICYIFLTKIVQIDYKIAASVAWALSVLFAFVTNKIWVFRRGETGGRQLVKECAGFIFFRVLSYFVDLATIIILVEWLGVFDVIAKLIASGVVAVLNYIASKYYIFSLKKQID